MSRKRAPGGGSKPKGPFKGKTATLTTRITAETRRALEAAAKRSRRSLSQEAEHLLRGAMQKPPGEPRNRAMAHAVAVLAQKIEDGTRKTWLDDAFTNQSLRLATDALLHHCGPDPVDEVVVPAAIQEAAAKMPPEFAAAFRTPGGFGHVVAYNLILQIEQALPATPNNEWSLPIFLDGSPEVLSMLCHDLGLATKKGKAS